eukprot:4629673-Amphidinium_carterae.1
MPSYLCTSCLSVATRPRARAPAARAKGDYAMVYPFRFFPLLELLALEQEFANFTPCEILRRFSLFEHKENKVQNKSCVMQFSLRRNLELPTQLESL